MTRIQDGFPAEAWLDEIQFSNASFDFAITGSNIYSTEDGGNTWEIETYHSTIPSGLVVKDLHVLSDTVAFTCGSYRPSALTRPGVFENISKVD